MVIVSAFLSVGVVNDDFLKKLEAALARGVKVWIAYGMGNQGGGDRDRERSPDWTQAKSGLERLRKKYQDIFQLKDMGNTHEKILLCDNDYVVSGSFNWLSFRGDKGRRIRYEDALQVSEPAIIDHYFTEITKRFGKT